MIIIPNRQIQGCRQSEFWSVPNNVTLQTTLSETIIGTTPLIIRLAPKEPAWWTLGEGQHAKKLKASIQPTKIRIYIIKYMEIETLYRERVPTEPLYTLDRVCSTHSTQTNHDNNIYPQCTLYIFSPVHTPAHRTLLLQHW